jgi:DNA-binding NarL/FixJ family response regulator
MCALRTVKVLIVDDHAILREGLTYLLEKVPQIDVVEAVATGKQAVAAALRHQPDIIVMDLVLPEISGLDATIQILRTLPETRVIILSSHDTREHVHHALRAGARGYVLKQSAFTELTEAVFTVLRGKRFLSAELNMEMSELKMAETGESPMERLSVREREVLYLTVESLTSAQIAKRLSLSPKTVATYRSRIMQKLGVSDRTALIRYAMQNVIIPR